MITCVTFDTCAYSSRYIPCSALTQCVRMYDFPPFFTKQPNEDTWRLQLKLWLDVVHDWCVKNNDYHVSSTSPVFTNTAIDRTLNSDTAELVLTELCRSGRAEKSGTGVIVYKHLPRDLAAKLVDWARETGHEKAVFTFYELGEGELPGLTDFVGADNLVLTRVAEILAKSDKAVPMKEEGEYVGMKMTL